MPKRKRFEPVSEAEDVPENRAVRSQRQQLEYFLDHGKTVVFRSLKVARGFERQKLGRRQKTAKANNDDAETARLEAEVAALKVWNLYIT